jgi:hypothetical protein
MIATKIAGTFILRLDILGVYDMMMDLKPRAMTGGKRSIFIVYRGLTEILPPDDG